MNHITAVNQNAVNHRIYQLNAVREIIQLVILNTHPFKIFGKKDELTDTHGTSRQNNI